MKKVLITGASGFIGNHLTQRILAMGYQVIALYNQRPIGFKHPNLIPVQLDFISSSLSKVIKIYCPDALIHTAACNPSVLISGEQQAFAEINESATLQLAESFIEVSEKGVLNVPTKFINLSTYEIYGNCENPNIITEKSPLNPCSAYAESKAKTHLALEAIQSKSVDFINVVCSNNYGPGQRDDKLIPAILKQMISNQPIDIYGDGSSCRIWTYVSDTCQAVEIILANCNQKRYHVCSDQDATVIEMVRMIHKLLYQKKLIKSDHVDINWHPSNTNPTFRISNTWTQQQLNWTANTDLQTGIIHTIDELSRKD